MHPDVTCLASVPVLHGANADSPWDEFDSESYFLHNYLHLREEDRIFLEETREFFASAAERLSESARGIDVGTGANLYPAFLMLPYCVQLTLWEPSKANVEWLRKEVACYQDAWNQFWQVLCVESRYQSLEDPRKELALRARVTGSAGIFELAETDERWDIGTMFFVAESLSNLYEEFSLALKIFISILKPGAPYAIAFMENSTGYRVGHQQFPAVCIDESDIRRELEQKSSVLKLTRVGIQGTPLRSGYSGMILACGLSLPESEETC